MAALDKPLIKNVCKIAILMVTLLHVVKIFFPVNLLPLLFISTAILSVFGLFLQGHEFRKITLFFFVIGSAILAYYKMPFEVWMQSLVSMTNIIAIIVVMQLFSLPIEIGKYSNTVEYWLKKSFKKESSLYIFATLITNMFSSFLLFGTVPIMVALFRKALKNNISDYQRFLATAIVRGYTLVLFWAPGAVIMLLVLQVTRVSWFDLFLPGLLLSVIGLATSYTFEHFTHLNKPIAAVATDKPTMPETVALAKKQSIHIIMVVLGLVILISLLEIFSIGSGTQRVLLAGLIISGIWLFYYRKHNRFLGIFRKHWRKGITNATDFSVFFIAMGLFAGAVDKSGILTHIQPVLQHSVNQFGLFSIIIVPLIFILIALIGIHPLILVVILGKILLTVSLPLPMVSIALLLILSSSISFIVSPFAGMILLTSKFLNVKPTDVALKWNALFCAIFLVEGIIFACLWR